MPTCPKGHASVATDYCDECGTPIGAPSVPPPAAPAVAAPTPASATPVPPEGSGAPCPECQTPRDGRFCETCGYDFLAKAAPKPAAATSGGAQPVPVGPQWTAAPSTAGLQWRVVVAADRDYHERMMAIADSDAEPVTVPAYYPERRFPLTGAEVLIGRRSRSRGIEPGVDLSGPPEDAAVSHMHALLVRTPEGTWNLVDLDSANGTYVNRATTPIAPNQPVPVADGDQIHIGAWTTLTIQAFAGTSAAA